MKPLAITAFLDGRLGHEKQTRGVLQALGELTPVQVAYQTISPLSFSTAMKQWIAYVGAKTLPPGKIRPAIAPDLIIGTGSYTHIPMILLKKAHAVPVVTCMTPTFPLTGDMDLCLIPRHDAPKPAANVFVSLGPPNTARDMDRRDPNKGLILIGGQDEKSHTWSSDRVLTQVKTVLESVPHLGWTLSSSPRTPEGTIQHLAHLAADHPGADFFRAEDTPAGWIETAYATSHTVWVTADSISMVYEALTAGCRVGILPVQWKHPSNKFQNSLDDLIHGGYVVSFEHWPTEKLLPEPPARLDEANRCAREILKRWWPERLP